jgi:DNA-directed RNA polymerase specialized sigma24 family protein
MKKTAAGVEELPPEPERIKSLLRRLAEREPRLARHFQLRFLEGRNVEEIALIMDVPVRTANRDYLLLRTWLHQHLKGE